MACTRESITKYLTKFTEFMDEEELERYFPWFQSLDDLYKYVIDKALLFYEDNQIDNERALIVQTLEKYGLTPFRALNDHRYDNDFYKLMIMNVELDKHYESTYTKFDEVKFYEMLIYLYDKKYDRDEYYGCCNNKDLDRIKYYQKLATKAKNKK